MGQRVLEIKLPEAPDEIGRWLERNGGRIEIGCSFGKYDVSISWRKVHSYSDDEGVHRESWELSRHGSDLRETLGAALQAAFAKTKGAEK